MGRSLSAAQAAAHLGVRVETVYAYVSRGRLERTTAPDGRRSLFDLDALDSFVAERRGRPPGAPRGSLDVEVDTAITRLGNEELFYRDRSVTELAEQSSFESVAELLWGVGPLEESAWRPTAIRAARSAARAATRHATAHDRLIMIVTRLGAVDPERRRLEPHSVARAAAGVIATLASASGPDRDNDSIAGAVVRAMGFEQPAVFESAIGRALILLADHGLASSTLAVRVAASVRSDLYGCLTAGLGVMGGPLHGGAAAEAQALFERCERGGVAPTIAAELAAKSLVPGFGHKIYRNDDPRWRPLFDSIPVTDRTGERLAVVDEATSLLGAALTVRPNIDWALGALGFVAGLEPRAIDLVMSIARLAGWTAHAIEEYSAAPVRFRGVARYTSGTAASI